MKLKRTLSALLAFVMLAGSALVSAPAFADTPLPFEDVKADAWYYDAVADVYEVGLMKGKTETKFDPTAPMSRAEFVTVLSRLAAINTGNYGYSDSLSFTDTDPEAWYADAAGWAVETGLTKGTSDTTFAPTREITRQEMAVLIVRFVKYLGETVPDNSKVEKFADSDKIASWATADIETMRKYGFIQGDQNGNFNPEGKADRASVATIAMRLLPFVTTTNVVEQGKSDYVIVSDESAIDAAERLQYQIEYTTGASLDIVESSSAKKAIVLKTESDEKLGADGYEIKTSGETVTITANTPEGAYKGAVRFALRATFDSSVKFTGAAAERHEYTPPVEKLTVNGNDISKYTIYYPANGAEKTLKAVEELVKYLELACGVKLPTSTAKPGDFAIIVDETTVVIEGSVNMNEDNFTVKTEGNNIRLQGAPQRGVIYAAYDFLEDIIGWVFLSTSQDYIEPAKSIDIKNINYTESPVFAYRDNYGSVPADKFRDYAWPSANGIHTFASLAPDYCAQYVNQPCLLDEAVYDQVIENVFKALEKKPESRMISVSVNDMAVWCTCADCTAAIAAESGTDYLLRFVNRVAEEIEKRGYDNVMVHTFAYAECIAPPINVKPRDNVMIQFCPITACNAHSITAGCNAGEHSDYIGKYIQGWADIGCTMNTWTYHGNFSNIVPHTDFRYETMAADMAYYADCGSIGGFTQLASQGSDTLNDFSNLRIYLLSELMWNPYMTEEEYDEHIKKFMKGYYGDGWELIYDVLMETMDVDNLCHRIFDGAYERDMIYRYRLDTEKLVEQFDLAELQAESMTVWKNIDRNQIQYNVMDVGIKFNQAEKDGDTEYMQILGAFIQNKLLTYGSMVGCENNLYPNIPYGEHQWNPWDWKGLLDPPYFVTKMKDVTVEYSDKPIYIKPLSMY